MGGKFPIGGEPGVSFSHPRGHILKGGVSPHRGIGGWRAPTFWGPVMRIRGPFSEKGEISQHPGEYNMGRPVEGT